MNKEELIGKLQMVYVGDINALNELIGYYDGLKQVIEELQQENKQIKENYDRIYNENCKLREEHNINDISLLDENQKLKDNWNELKRWLYEDHCLYVPEIARNSTYQKVLEKMYEIEKESNSNEI